MKIQEEGTRRQRRVWTGPLEHFSKPNPDLENIAYTKYLTGPPSGQISRILRRLRTHGLIKKASHCYKYYLTVLGKQVVALGLKLKELVIIPQLAAAPCR